MRAEVETKNVQTRGRCRTAHLAGKCLALAAFVAAGCSSEYATTPPPAPVDWHAFEVPHAPASATAGPTAKEQAVAELYAQALAAPGFGQLPSRIDADAHFSFPGLPDAQGKSAVLKAHDALFGSFDNRAVAASRIWKTEAVQVVEWTLAGVQARDWMGVAPTSKPAAIKGLTLLWTRDDGSITDVHVYFDLAVVKAQLGAGPKELAGLPLPQVPTTMPQVFTEAHDAVEARDVAVTKSWLDALEKADDATYLAMATDDVTVDTLQRAQPMRGKEDLKAYFKTMHKSVGQLDTTVENALGATTYCIVEYSIAGEQLGPIGWVAAQRDKVIKLRVADVVELREGKVAHVARYDNLAQIAAQGL